MILDPRNIQTGPEIPSEGYVDQPYVVVTKTGEWLCVLTTGAGVEGDYRQHIVATRSSDKGKTWSPLVDIEPVGPPESSWVMPFITPSGRVYVFYNHNTDNVTQLPGYTPPPGWFPPDRHRVDTLGHFVFKYSDDGGKTWSKERYDLPLRTTEIDRENAFGGKVLCFWGVGKPTSFGNSMILGLAKVGGDFSRNFMDRSEGIFFRSDNIMTEMDPENITWEMLPDGDIGLRAPIGDVADEHNPTSLSDGSLYCTYRTVDGFLCHAYSRDGGHTWDGPQHATYTPGGRKIKHGRAACFVRKYSNGKFTLWYHNHGGKYFMDRNPVWLAGGTEKDGYIHWSEPEIVLYDPNPRLGISYPDFIEQDGKYWITETQKTIARSHEIDSTLLEGLWSQGSVKTVARDGLIFEARGDALKGGSTLDIPALPELGKSNGVTFDFWVKVNQIDTPVSVFDSRNRAGMGVTLEVLPWGAARVTLGGHRMEDLWESDRGMLQPGGIHHVVAIVDDKANILSFVVDGRLNDGGSDRLKGWKRLIPELGPLGAATTASVSDSPAFELLNLRIYDRYIRTSEAIGNYHAGI